VLYFSLHLPPACADCAFFADLAFGDSDVMWAQHSSGTFSQIDLRDCVKSVDLITSKAVT
jgi:hypothetical protein